MKFALVLVAFGFVACMAQSQQNTAASGNTCSEEDASALGKALGTCRPSTNPSCHCGDDDTDCQERFKQMCECMDAELTGKEFYEAMKTTCGFQDCTYNKAYESCMGGPFHSCMSAFKGAKSGRPNQSALYSLF